MTPEREERGEVLAELKLVREQLDRLTAAVAARPASESYVDHEVLEKHFGVSRATIHNWVHKEGCPHVLRGKVLRFQMSAVEAWFHGRGPNLKRVK